MCHIDILDIFQPEILHFCLSAEHVLVDDRGSCRLTGFDFKHNVLLREMEEEDEGVKLPLKHLHFGVTTVKQ